MNTPFRIGLGEDIHRTASGGPLRLGGACIPHDQHLVGHSDADVLLHAITDSLLGAAGLPDIGELFPDTDPVNRNRDSCQLLRIAADQLASMGYSIGNLDCVVVAQQPKLAPYKRAMRQQIAELLSIDIAQVNIKGKTGEKVGPVGRMEAVEARCVALIVR